MSQGFQGHADAERAGALAQAVQALAGGEKEEAAEIAERLLQQWPHDGGVHQLMAAIALRRSEPEVAERWALSSLALRPDNVPTLMLAAAAARSRGDWPRAQERYARAAELEPNRPEAAFGMTIAAIEVDAADAPRAVEALRRRFPDPSPAWAEIGSACERAGRWDFAAEAFASAAKARPSAKLWLRSGAALLAMGRRGEAAAAFGAALQLDPASAEAWFKLGLTFQDSRHFDRAAQAYRRALELRPDLAEAEANLGVTLQQLGELEEAKQAYGRAINLKPSAFGRIAQALTTEPKGELWLDLAALRAHLSEVGRLSR